MVYGSCRYRGVREYKREGNGPLGIRIPWCSSGCVDGYILHGSLLPGMTNHHNHHIMRSDNRNSGHLRQDFVKDPERAKRWSGLRQDSGDPFVYAPRAREVYQSMNIDHTTRVIIYSDGLTVDKALALKKQCDELGFTGMSTGCAI